MESVPSIRIRACAPTGRNPEAGYRWRSVRALSDIDLGSKVICVLYRTAKVVFEDDIDSARTAPEGGGELCGTPQIAGKISLSPPTLLRELCDFTMASSLYYKLWRKSCRNELWYVCGGKYSQEVKQKRENKYRDLDNALHNAKKNPSTHVLEPKNEIKRPETSKPLLLIILGNNRLVGPFAFASTVRASA